MSTQSIQLDLSDRSLATLYTLFMSAHTAQQPDLCTTVVNNMVTTTEGEYAGGSVIEADSESIVIYVREDGNHVMYASGTWSDGHGHTQDLRFEFFFDDSGEVLKHTAEVLESV